MFRKFYLRPPSWFSTLLAWIPPVRMQRAMNDNRTEDDLMAEQQLQCELHDTIFKSRPLRHVNIRLFLGYMFAIIAASYALQRSLNICHWVAITPFLPWTGSTAQLYDTYCACQKTRSVDTLPDRTLNILNKLAWPISEYSTDWYEGSPVKLPSLQFLSNALDPLKASKIGMDNLTLALGPALSANVKHHRKLIRDVTRFRRTLSRSGEDLDAAVKELGDRLSTAVGRGTFFDRARCRVLALEVLWRIASLSDVCNRIQTYRQDVAHSAVPISDLVEQTDAIIDQSLQAIQESLYALSEEHRRRYLESHPRWRNPSLSLPTSLLKLTPSVRHDLYVLARLHMWLTLFRFNNIGVRAPLALETAILDAVCSSLLCTQYSNDYSDRENQGSGSLNIGAHTDTTSHHGTVISSSCTVRRMSWLQIGLEASTLVFLFISSTAMQNSRCRQPDSRLFFRMLDF